MDAIYSLVNNWSYTLEVKRFFKTKYKIHTKAILRLRRRSTHKAHMILLYPTLWLSIRSFLRLNLQKGHKNLNLGCHRCTHPTTRRVRNLPWVASRQLGHMPLLDLRAHKYKRGLNCVAKFSAVSGNMLRPCSDRVFVTRP